VAPCLGVKPPPRQGCVKPQHSKKAVSNRDRQHIGQEVGRADWLSPPIRFHGADGWAIPGLRDDVSLPQTTRSPRIQRAADAQTGAIQDMGIDLRSGDVFVTEEFLDSSDV
jgi:hypothetical protein